MSDASSRIIFPGWSTHDQEQGPTTIHTLRCIADALETSGRKLPPETRRSVNTVLHISESEPGPLTWRYRAEQSAGGGSELLRYLDAASHLLHQVMDVGVEPGVASRLSDIIDGLEHTLADEPARGRERFRWLLEDMIQCLRLETSDDVFGAIETRIDESAGLAVLLGFQTPPVQYTSYERDGAKSVKPFVGAMMPDPAFWVTLKYKRPEVMYMFGYRVHDPADRRHVDVFTSNIVESVDENSPRLCTESVGSAQEKTEELIKYLNRWVSAIDGLPPATLPTTESEQHEGTGSPQHKKRPGRKAGSMAESFPAEKLRAIAGEIRSIVSRRDSEAERYESAGRLLIAALKAGAFEEPSFAGFRELVQQRLEQPRVNGWISAWVEAVWWLRKKPQKRPSSEDTLPEDCEFVADLLETEAAKLEEGEGNMGGDSTPRRKKRDAGAKKDKPKRGRRVAKETIRRADFAQPLREEGKTWEEIAAEYSKKHPRDIDANADTMRLAYERQYPKAK